MITPTDEQVEAALLPCPFCGGEAILVEWSFDAHNSWVECSKCEVMVSADSANSTWQDHNTHQHLREISNAEAAEKWNRRALTAAFSLAAPAGTVDNAILPNKVLDDNYARALAADGASGSMTVDTSVMIELVNEVKASRSALLPPQPSAALPGKDAASSLEEIVKDAVIETASRPPGLRGPYVFDEVALQTRAAALASQPQPQPEGEVVAWRKTDQHGFIEYEENNVRTMSFADWVEAGWDALYLHPAPTLQGAGLIEAPTHRHVKRGCEYVLLGIGKMQSENWTNGDLSPTSIDMREVAIYRSVEDGSLWARPREEFEDGRFAALSPQRGDGK